MSVAEKYKSLQASAKHLTDAQNAIHETAQVGEALPTWMHENLKKMHDELDDYVGMARRRMERIEEHGR